MPNCKHTWQEIGGESSPERVVTHQRCMGCGEERTIETPRAALERRRVLEQFATELDRVAARARAMATLMTPVAPEASAPPLGELTALARADIRAELQIRVEECEGSAKTLARHGDSHGAASWRSRALRIRELIALLAVLLLCACAEQHGRIEGPPLYVHLCDAMPAADQAAWGEAAGALNAELDEPAVWVGHGAPIGCASVDVCPGSEAETRVGACVITVRYRPGTARDVAAQELDLLLEGMP